MGAMQHATVAVTQHGYRSGAHPITEGDRSAGHWHLQQSIADQINLDPQAVIFHFFGQLAIQITFKRQPLLAHRIVRFVDLFDLLLVVSGQPVKRLIEPRQNLRFVADTAHIGVIDRVLARPFGQRPQVGHWWQAGRDELAIVILFGRHRFSIRQERINRQPGGGIKSFAKLWHPFPFFIEYNGVKFFPFVIGTVGDTPGEEEEMLARLLHTQIGDPGIQRAHGVKQLFTTGKAHGQPLLGDETVTLQIDHHLIKEGTTVGNQLLATTAFHLLEREDQRLGAKVIGQRRREFNLQRALFLAPVHGLDRGPHQTEKALGKGRQLSKMFRFGNGGGIICAFAPFNGTFGRFRFGWHMG